MYPRNVARAEDFFCGVGIKVVTGCQYLGVFVGDRETKDSWMEENAHGLTEPVKALLGVAKKHPQSAYAGL